MGTKLNPGNFDCYGNALPDEPMFILLARDPQMAFLVRTWAELRENSIACGERPNSDMAMVYEASDCATAAEEWRRLNLGKWRKPPLTEEG